MSPVRAILKVRVAHLKVGGFRVATAQEAQEGGAWRGLKPGSLVGCLEWVGAPPQRIFSSRASSWSLFRTECSRSTPSS
jgi:hypothetical protein